MGDSEQLEHRVTALEARVIELEQTLSDSEEIPSDGSTVADDDWILTTDNESATIRQAVLDAITEYERSYGESVPIDHVIESATEQGHATPDVHETIEALLREGSIYEPTSDHVRVV